MKCVGFRPVEGEPNKCAACGWALVFHVEEMAKVRALRFVVSPTVWKELRAAAGLADEATKPIGNRAHRRTS